MWDVQVAKRLNGFSPLKLIGHRNINLAAKLGISVAMKIF